MTRIDGAATVANPRMTYFVGGDTGEWEVTSHNVLTGTDFAQVTKVGMVAGMEPVAPESAWILRGLATNARYTTQDEAQRLSTMQAPIGRPEATRAALILLRKSDAWWALAQDDRRTILEEQSHHIAIGMRYLPAIARKLLHCRDLGTDEPFDFLGFLDFAPEDEAGLDEMLVQLRATREWSFMEREVDIRLRRTRA
jgi:hypothetical protein